MLLNHHAEQNLSIEELTQCPKHDIDNIYYLEFITGVNSLIVAIFDKCETTDESEERMARKRKRNVTGRYASRTFLARPVRE